MPSIPWIRFVFVMLLTSSSNISSILVPPYLHDRGYDYISIGVLVACIGIAALLSRFPVGAMYRRERGRLLCTLGAAGLACAYMLYPLATNAITFAMVQIMVGVCSGISTTINMAMFMDTVPKGADRAKAMAFFAGALAGGHTVGNLVGGFAGDLLGYDNAFRAGAAMTAASLLFLWFDNPDPATLDEPRQRHLGPALPFGQRVAASVRAMSEPKLVIIAMVQFLLNFLHSMISTFFPLYALGIGLSLSEIGMLKSVHSLVNTFARPAAGSPIKWIGATRASIVGLGLMGLLDALLPIQTMVWGFAILLASIGLIRAIVLVGNTVELASIDESRISRGLASSLYSSSQDLGSLTSPALCGAIASLVGLTAMMGTVPLAAAGVFYLAVIWQHRRAKPVSVTAST
jgi:predicted MFS family arabinose efflux permease